jgi:hypothetical protein
MRITAFLVIVFCLSYSAFAKTIHVPGDYPTIQGAIDAAAPGDTVLVDPGLYVENIDFLGKAITVKSSQGPYATRIDGDQAKEVVLFTNNEGRDSVLEGFTLMNGRGIRCNFSSPTITKNIITRNGHASGAGIMCRVGSKPLIIHNLITKNTVGHGGIECDLASPDIVGNTISGNGAGYQRGGGISCVECSPYIDGNRIEGNSSDLGGGIFCYGYSWAVIVNNIISENSATYLGGGIYVEESLPTVSNNVFYQNASRSGGGLACWIESYMEMANNTFFRNVAEEEGGALWVFSASITTTNTILWHDEAPVGPEIYLDGLVKISYSDVDGGQASVYVHPSGSLKWGPGMIDSDPQFADEAGGDLHILYSSPCIDTGKNQPPGHFDVDFEGDPRIAYIITDMGADEHHTHLYHTGNAAPGGAVEIKFTDRPGTAPVGLFIGAGLLDPPLPSKWGDWYLLFPVVGPIDLGAIPGPEGLLILPGELPASPPGPYDIHLQAILGDTLSNHHVLAVSE